MKRLIKECYNNCNGRRKKLADEIDKKWPFIVKFNFILLVFVLLIQMIVGFSSDETLKIHNSKRTEGTIVEITNIKRKSSVIRRQKVREYRIGTLTIKYEVNGKEYFIKEEVVANYTESNKIIGEWKEGDKVKIVYNEKNPYDAVRDETELYEMFIYIILGIIAFVCVDIEIEKIREKIKNKKAEKIERTNSK